MQQVHHNSDYQLTIWRSAGESVSFYNYYIAEHGNLQEIWAVTNSLCLHYAVANNGYSLVHGKLIPVTAYFCAT